MLKSRKKSAVCWKMVMSLEYAIFADCQRSDINCFSANTAAIMA
jgi:hypothetical protein